MHIQTKMVKEKHRENGGKSHMINYAIPIIATLPDGRKVEFKSLSKAERTLGIDSTYLSKALRRDNPEFGGWLWTRSNGETITESLTEEMISTFQNPVRGKKKATPISRYENPIEVVPKKSERIETGYFMPGFSPCICPICHIVVKHNEEQQHLKRCIGDRPYTIKNGVIKVIVSD